MANSLHTIKSPLVSCPPAVFVCTTVKTNSGKAIKSQEKKSLQNVQKALFVLNNSLITCQYWLDIERFVRYLSKFAACACVLNSYSFIKRFKKKRNFKLHPCLVSNHLNNSPNVFVDFNCFCVKTNLTKTIEKEQKQQSKLNKPVCSKWKPLDG